MNVEETQRFIDHVADKHGFDVSLPQPDWRPTAGYHLYLHATRPDEQDHAHPPGEFAPQPEETT